MAHVFLSHSSADAEGAKAVARLLQNAGLPVWLDLDRLIPGDAWQPALEAALAESTHFVVLVGHTGVERWVDREVRYALDRNTADPNYRVIPLLGPGANEAALPLFLKQQHYLSLDWRGPDAHAVQQLAAAILQTPPDRVRVLPPGQSPFCGLLTFEAENSLLFFGRDREVDELLSRLSHIRFLPLVGDSGSGKSSLVRAGLIPALMRGRAGSFDWRVATMKPGQDPLDSLAKSVPQFHPSLGPADSLDLIGKAKSALHCGGGLSDILAALQLAANSRQLLFIDQFEQLFTLAPPESAARFVTTLLHAAQDPNSGVHVVLTLRVDFFGLCHRYPDLWQLLTRDHYSVERMQPARLRDVIEKPMALAGVTLPPGLADTMIEDAGTQPGALALLEHALDQLWTESKAQPPTFDQYQKIGRLKGALRAHADRVLKDKLTTAGQREMARRIFVELTALGQGTEDSARRVPKPKLLSLPGKDAEAVLQTLTEERLVTVGDANDRESVSIAHEALIREWDTLRKWLDGGRQDIAFQRDLELAEAAWRKDPDQALRGARLKAAIDWKQRNEAEAEGLKQFIQTSRNSAQRSMAFQWGFVLFIIGVLFWLSLPTIKIGFYSALRSIAPGRINPNDGLKYVYIPAGKFKMGCSLGDKECQSDETNPPKDVTIDKGFWLGQTEVTQAAWKKVNHGENPSKFKSGQLPVEQVSWIDAYKYCESIGGRLPTEQEWEYAARGGNTGPRYGELSTIAWYGSKSDGSTHPVATKLPNTFGLYDMLGNVWEWTSTDYEKNTKVLRGGAWNDYPTRVRISLRTAARPTNRFNDLGFRCVAEFP